jgi:hypothetical protein
MNTIDLVTDPVGIPMESDGILDAMQRNYQDAILALAKMAQEPSPGFGVVLSGCVVTGSTMTDGWILLNRAGTYEVLFFEGGAVGSLYIIQETTEDFANEDGTVVPRIYSRKCVFGTGGTTYQFQDLYKFGSISEAFQNLAVVAKGGGGDWTNWVLLYGFNAVSGGSGGISAGVALYNGKVVVAAAYGSPVSSGSPVYLDRNGAWSTSAPSGVFVTFNPYSDRHLRCFQRKALHPIGSLLPIKTGVAELTTFFDGTGLGLGERLGWAIANGNNSTLNLSSAISGVSWIQRMS